MAFVFGNDYGGVAAMQQNYDALNAKLAQDAQARQDAAYRFNQQRADDQAQNAATTQQNWYKAQNDAATNQYQFGAQQGQQRQEFEETLAAQKDQTKQKKNDADYAEAYQVVSQGEVDDPTKLNASFPNLTPQQVAKLQIVWGGINKTKGTQYQFQQSIADQLNSEIAEKEKAKLNQVKVGREQQSDQGSYPKVWARAVGNDLADFATVSLAGQSWVPGVNKVAAIKPEEFKLTPAEVDAVLTPHAKQKWGDHVEYDDATGKYVPVMPPPAGWSPRPTDAPVQAAPAAQPTAAVQPALPPARAVPMTPAQLARSRQILGQIRASNPGLSPQQQSQILRQQMMQEGFPQ